MFCKLSFKEDFINTFKNCLLQDTSTYLEIDTFLYKVCTNIFDIIPSKYKLSEYPTYGKNKDVAGQNNISYIDLSVEDIEKWKNLLLSNTYNSCKKYLEKNHINFLEYRYEDGAFIVTENQECILHIYHEIYVFSANIYLPQWIEDNCVFPEDNKYSYNYLVYDSDSGFNMFPMKINKQEIDIENNYNDDLPHNEINDFLNSDESGLVILHGLAGAGKTTYIRHLITSVDKRFIYLDQMALDNMTDMSFIRTLSKYTNSVIIIEDCEVLLSEREKGNASISSLLNLTDGIIGDSFKFKIICTFNSDLTRLDKALLRKGRLKIKYNFDYLSKEKVDKLSNKLGIEIEDKSQKMTLSEVYNYKEKVDYEKQKNKTIGFTR